MIHDTTRPRVLVSRCLLGEAVRYDGTDRRCAALAGLADQCELLPVCPEAEAGLGVPRPPVQWVRLPDGDRLRGRDDPALDVTDSLTAFCRRYVKALPVINGAVLKARSPSCGIGDVPLFDTQGRELQCLDGLFVQVLRERFPALPMIDEAGMEDDALRERFLAAVRAAV